MAKKLNVSHTKEDKFEVVDFVHGKTQHQLKILIRDMWLNLQEIANVLEDSRPDITEMIDLMLDGKTINPKQLRERHQYFQVGDAIVQYDCNTNSINVLDSDGEVVSSNIQGYDLKIIRATLRKKLEHVEKGSK